MGEPLIFPLALKIIKVKTICLSDSYNFNHIYIYTYIYIYIYIYVAFPASEFIVENGATDPSQNTNLSRNPHLLTVLFRSHLKNIDSIQTGVLRFVRHVFAVYDGPKMLRNKIWMHHDKL